MSLQQTVNNVINDHMKNFFHQVVSKYPEINIKELIHVQTLLPSSVQELLAMVESLAMLSVL